MPSPCPSLNSPSPSPSPYHKHNAPGSSRRRSNTRARRTCSCCRIRKVSCNLMNRIEEHQRMYPGQGTEFIKCSGCEKQNFACQTSSCPSTTNPSLGPRQSSVGGPATTKAERTREGRRIKQIRSGRLSTILHGKGGPASLDNKPGEHNVLGVLGLTKEHFALCVNAYFSYRKPFDPLPLDSAIDSSQIVEDAVALSRRSDTACPSFRKQQKDVSGSRLSPILMLAIACAGLSLVESLNGQQKSDMLSAFISRFNALALQQSIGTLSGKFAHESILAFDLMNELSNQLLEAGAIAQKHLTEGPVPVPLPLNPDPKQLILASQSLFGQLRRRLAQADASRDEELSSLLFWRLWKHQLMIHWPRANRFWSPGQQDLVPAYPTNNSTAMFECDLNNHLLRAACQASDALAGNGADQLGCLPHVVTTYITSVSEYASPSDLWESVTGQPVAPVPTLQLGMTETAMPFPHGSPTLCAAARVLCSTELYIQGMLALHNTVNRYNWALPSDGGSDLSTAQSMLNQAILRTIGQATRIYGEASVLGMARCSPWLFPQCYSLGNIICSILEQGNATSPTAVAVSHGATGKVPCWKAYCTLPDPVLLFPHGAAINVSPEGFAQAGLTLVRVLLSGPLDTSSSVMGLDLSQRLQRSTNRHWGAHTWAQNIKQECDKLSPAISKDSLAKLTETQAKLSDTLQAQLAVNSTTSSSPHESILQRSRTASNALSLSSFRPSRSTPLLNHQKLHLASDRAAARSTVSMNTNNSTSRIDFGKAGWIMQQSWGRRTSASESQVSSASSPVASTKPTPPIAPLARENLFTAPIFTSSYSTPSIEHSVLSSNASAYGASISGTSTHSSPFSPNTTPPPFTINDSVSSVGSPQFTPFAPLSEPEIFTCLPENEPQKPLTCITPEDLLNSTTSLINPVEVNNCTSHAELTEPPANSLEPQGPFPYPLPTTHMPAADLNLVEQFFNLTPDFLTLNVTTEEHQLPDTTMTTPTAPDQHSFSGFHSHSFV